MTLEIALGDLIGLVFAAFGGLVAVVILNWREHQELHRKIDGVHHSIRDRLDKMWSHITRDTPGS